MDFSKNKLERLYPWLLLAVCFVSLFVFLGDTWFNTRGSSREAVVALTMLKDGNWILPVNNGVDLAYKPPFLHWLIALFSLPGGEVTEFTSRLPSALALMVMTLAGYRFFARRRGAGVAFLMGLLTLTAFETHRAGMSCRVDMLLACMMVLSLYLLYGWVRHGQRGVPWGAVLCLSAAFLTKGPVGAALPCLVAWIFASVRGKGWAKSLPPFLAVGLLSCILPLAWYVAAWGQGGDKFLHLVYEENVLRLIGKMSYASHVNPWYYNVMTVTAGFLPYTLLVLPVLFVLPWRRLRMPLRTLWGKCKARLRALDNARLFSLLSFVVIFVFYCIPKSKRSTYLLPVYPFLAYFLAEFILWLRHRHRRILRGYGWLLWGLAVVLLLSPIFIYTGALPEKLLGGSFSETGAALWAAQCTPLMWVKWGLAGLLLLAAIGVCGKYLYKGTHLTATAAALVFCMTLYIDGILLPPILNKKSDKPVAVQITRLVPEGRIYSFRTDVTPGNPLHPFTINFYLGDRIVPFEPFMPRRGWLLAGNDDIDAFKARYPQYRVEEKVDFRHRSCDDHKYIHLYTFSCP